MNFVTYKWKNAGKIWRKMYHSVACFILELGRKDLFPEMLGFSSPTVTTPISTITCCAKLKLNVCIKITKASIFQTDTKKPYKFWCLEFTLKLLRHKSHTQIPKFQSFNETSTPNWNPSQLSSVWHKSLIFWQNGFKGLKEESAGVRRKSHESMQEEREVVVTLKPMPLMSVVFLMMWLI